MSLFWRGWGSKHKPQTPHYLTAVIAVWAHRTPCCCYCCYNYCCCHRHRRHHHHRRRRRRRRRHHHHHHHHHHHYNGKRMHVYLVRQVKGIGLGDWYEMSQYPATVEVYPTAQGQLVQKPRHHLVVDESLVSEVIAHLLLILRGALVGTFSRVRASNLEATPFRDLNVRKTTNYFVCYTCAAGLGTSGEILTLAFMCSVGSVRVMIRATMFCCSFSRRYIYWGTHANESLRTNWLKSFQSTTAEPQAYCYIHLV